MIRDLPRDLEELGLDDPLALMVGTVRDELAQQQQAERGKVPAARRAWFNVPAPPQSSRLRSAGGFESFHFAVNRPGKRAAASFDDYATGKDREGVVQDISIEQGREALTFDAYTLGHGVDGPGEAPDFVTTLDPRANVRQRQWDAIEKHERSLRRNALPGPPRINLRYERAPELLLDAAMRSACPSGLRAVIFAERDRAERGEGLPARLVQNGVPWISDDAPRAMAWLQSLPAWPTDKNRSAREKAPPPAKLSPGRGVVTVIAGELELPDCLDAEGRRAVMHGLNAHVQQLGREGAHDRAAADEASAAVVPFLAVEHLPGRLNDKRNPHLHFQIGTRAVRIGDDGELEFAECKVEGLAAKGAIQRLRSEVARLINFQLDRLEADYRLSPKTYAELGIEAATQRKLFGERTVLERAGVPTEDGLANSAEGWRRQFAQAREYHASADALLVLRDAQVGSEIERETDRKRRQAREAERAAALADARRALALRLEIAEIAILVAMARSRGELVARYAPAYADKARRKDGSDTWDACSWRTRAETAAEHLTRLDVELAVEREALAEREREALRLETRSQARYAALVSAQQPGAVVEPARTPCSPAQAVSVIAENGLYVSEVGARLEVLPVDDPDDLVRGVDLSGQVKRLAGVRASQQRELTQLRARVRKHGVASLDDDQLGEATAWLREAARKWRGAPVLRRMAAADRAMATAHEALVRRGVDGPVLDYLPLVPPGMAEVDPALLAATGVIPADRGRQNPGAMRVPDRRPAVPLVKAPRVDVTVSRRSDEARLRREHRDRNARQRSSIDADIQLALKDRAGDEHSLTPHAARLLAKVRDGFDPARIAGPAAGRPRSLDRRDADEMAVLVRSPLFAARLERVRRCDPAILSQITRTLASNPNLDLLARVALKSGKVDFANPASGDGVLRTPEDLAERMLDAAGASLPRLSRRHGLVGLYDAELLERSGNNYLGLLYPRVQDRLEAAWYVQREEELGLLRRIATGEVKARPVVLSGEPPVARVEVFGETPDEQRIAGRCELSLEWFFACRAALKPGPSVAAVRHVDPAVRALLRATDDKAQPGVIEALGRTLRVRKPLPELDGMSAPDRRAIERALADPSRLSAAAERGMGALPGPRWPRGPRGPGTPRTR